MLRMEVNYLASALTVYDRGQPRSTLLRCRATEDDGWQNRSEESDGVRPGEGWPAFHRLKSLAVFGRRRASTSSLFILLTPRSNDIAAASAAFSPSCQHEWLPLSQWNSTTKSLISWRVLPLQTCMGRKDRAQAEGQLSVRGAGQTQQSYDALLLELKLTNDIIWVFWKEGRKKSWCEGMNVSVSMLLAFKAGIQQVVNQRWVVKNQCEFHWFAGEWLN